MNSSQPPGSLPSRTIRRRWLPILTLWAILTAGSLYAARDLLPPLYQATSILRVDPVADKLFDNVRDETSTSFIQTQVNLLSSSNIVAAAATNPQVARLPRVIAASDSVSFIRNEIRVVAIPQTYLIEVSMVSPSAHEAATLVNGVVEAFNDSHLEWSTAMSRNKIRSLENYRAELQNQSGELERQWKDLASRPEVEAKRRPDDAVDAALRGRIADRIIENELHRIEAVARLQAMDGAERDRLPVKVGELKAEIEVASVLDRSLRARLASIPEHLAAPRVAADEVNIAILRQQLAGLKELEASVVRRLEQLKFDAKGEDRIRTVQSAIAPGAPVTRGARSPAAILLISLATFALTFGCFAGIEARSGRVAAGPPTAV